MSTRYTEVFCTLRIDGTHNWPACDVPGVEFLRDPHRHMFHIKAYAAVNHDDRDIEFIALKRQIHQYFAEQANEYGSVEFGAKSCEMIANDLIDRFNLTCCEVNEDGENGAVVSVVADDVCCNAPSM